ncbi:MAG TPA: TetR family transcriptional regulator [Capillimicrobium sp.]
MAAAKPDRRTALLDATLRLIGEGGLEAVTHRAVEAAAGLPHGSTTYYFKTRQQLVDAAVQRLSDRDHAVVDAMGHGIAMALARGDGLDFDALAAQITAWVRADRAHQLVRFELYLAAARRPQIAETMRAARQTFLRMMEPVAVAAGSDDPEADARTLVALLDGLVLHQITVTPEGHEPTIRPRDVKRIIGSLAIR